MQKVNFQDGTKTSSAKVTIDNVDYPVTPARYTGATPLSSTVMNTMQTNIENAINQNADNIGGEDYDSTATYDVGDIVKYQGQLYICIEAVTTAEAFDSSKWEETDVLSSAGGNEIAIGSVSDITGKTKLFVEESTQTLKYKSSSTGQFENLTSEDIVIGEPEDVTSETKIFINEEEGTDAYSEVVNSLAGDEIAKAPSVRAVNEGLLDVYSTNEVRIGTWIDGKPLYRKVVEGTTSSTAFGENPISVATNVNKCVKIEGHFIFSDVSAATSYKLLSYYDNTNTYGHVYWDVVHTQNNLLRIRPLTNYVSIPIVAICYYTKTTD